MRVRLKADTVGLVWDNGRRRVSVVPKGAILDVSGRAPESEGMISVVWDTQDVVMFSLDVNQRGEHQIG